MKYVVLRSHVHFAPGDPEYRTLGYRCAAGHEDSVWTFVRKEDAQMLADYMNTPEYDFHLWRKLADLGHWVHTLEEYQQEFPEETHFAPCPQHVLDEVRQELVDIQLEAMRNAG